MKVIKIDLNKQFPKLKNVKYIEIYVIEDLHEGDPLFNKKEFIKLRDYIKDTENAFCILGGDLINNATKNSISDIYNEQLSPMQQINSLLDMLEPIKNKILAGVPGNHELRSFKESGIDIMALVMRELGISNRYAEEAYYIFLHFGEKIEGRKAPMCYTIYGTHGTGGGGTPGAKINKLVKMSNICYADLFVIGHAHEPIATGMNFFLPEYGNQVVKEKTMKFLMGNSFLNYGGYGERAGYSPACRDIVKATLYNGKRKVRCEV